MRTLRCRETFRSSETKGALATTCSKLSMTRSICRSCKKSFRLSCWDFPPASLIPRVWAIVDSTRLGSTIGASATNITPSAKWLSSSAATWRDRRVLPVPPGPVRVNSLMASLVSFFLMADTSTLRPINGVSWVRKLLGDELAIARVDDARRCPTSEPDWDCGKRSDLLLNSSSCSSFLRSSNNSLAVWYRSALSFARVLRTIRSNSSANSPGSCPSGAGALSWIETRTWFIVAPSKGTRPLTSS